MFGVINLEINNRIWLPDIVVKPELDYVRYSTRVLEKPTSSTNGIILKSFSIFRSTGYEYVSAYDVDVKPVVHLRADIALKGSDATGWQIDI